MKCREVLDFIADYLGGDLPAGTVAAFERHLSRCADCAQYLDQYRSSIALTRRACADDEASALAAGVPEDLVAAILAARRHQP